jgi:glycosyltransferase involved in cell wall biosynthesis
MRIALDARLLDKRHNTGISRYTEFLIDYYVSRIGENNVSLITNDPTLTVGSLKTIYTEYKPFNLIHVFLYRKFICQFSFELIHIPFYSGFYSKLPHTTVVLTVHDLMYRIVDDFFGKNRPLSILKIKYFNFIVKRSVCTADKVISISNTTSRDLKRIFKVDSYIIPEQSKIQSVPEISILNKHKLRNKCFFLYCGNSRPHKNLSMVVNLFNTLTNFPPLVLAGKGHQSSSNVINVGIVSDPELLALYESAIAFIFPSKYEGFGLPILEALSVGTLVIASRIPAFEEFKNQNICYFDIDNQSQLRSALVHSLTHHFVDNPSFFDTYSKENIYSLLDTYILNRL